MSDLAVVVAWAIIGTSVGTIAGTVFVVFALKRGWASRIVDWIDRR